MIPPELEIILIILVAVVLLYGVIAWLGIVLQSVLFQRYRLQKNEAALRKARLHDQVQEVQHYKSELLGEVKETAQE